jgi:hypothetical protein
MKSTGKGRLAEAAKAVSDEKLLRVMRQSNKLRNRRRLRRAITSTGKPRAPEWTLQEQALLGKMPDADAAQRLGRTIVAIRVRRQRLNLPKQFNELEVARRLGRTLTAVKARRGKLGLPQIDPPFEWWKPEEDNLLGTAPDAEIASRLGRSESSVKGRRLVLGIKFPNPRRPWPPDELALLGTRPDAVLAKCFNRPESVVRSKRLQLGRREPSESASG